MNSEFVFSEPWRTWAAGPAIAVAVWLAAWLAGGLLVRSLARLARRTATDLDESLLAAVRPFVPAWAAFAGVAAGVQALPLADTVKFMAGRGVQIGLVLSVTWAASRAVVEVVRRQSSGLGEVLPASTLTQNLVRVVIVGLGLLVVAGQLGIAITPILTALGVGSLAVALALQPTLTNLFAGIHISVARHIRVGDFIALENGGEGYVADIGWRSTQIRELPNNIIIVPNARLAEIVVKNYSLPENEQAALVQVGVRYGSDLARVERVTIEVARETLREVKGGVAAFDPFIRYHTFGDSAIGFTVILRVREFADRYLVTHEFVQRLHRRYAEEGIEIPFPQRVVHFAGRLGLEEGGARGDGAARAAAARGGPASG